MQRYAPLLLARRCAPLYQLRAPLMQKRAAFHLKSASSSALVVRGRARPRLFERRFTSWTQVSLGAQLAPRVEGLQPRLAFQVARALLVAQRAQVAAAERSQAASPSARAAGSVVRRARARSCSRTRGRRESRRGRVERAPSASPIARAMIFRVAQSRAAPPRDGRRATCDLRAADDEGRAEAAPPIVHDHRRSRTRGCRRARRAARQGLDVALRSCVNQAMAAKAELNERPPPRIVAVGGTHVDPAAPAPQPARLPRPRGPPRRRPAVILHGLVGADGREQVGEAARRS